MRKPKKCCTQQLCFNSLEMLRMKCSAYWVYYDIPHIYLFSELYIIPYEIIQNAEKNQVNQFDRKNLIYLKKINFFPTLA